jgi:serine/threonine protein kinase/sugar lactone lactonase YvrE
MSLCINPDCPQPDHEGNNEASSCQACGTTLILQGRYRVMRVLSNQTGFGVVYEAYERNLPKILKVLRRDRARVEKVLSLFKQEALVLSHLRHPGVPYVSTEGYFTLTPPQATEPLHCIVMEKIDGLNLKQWMQQQGNHPVHEEQAIGWLQQLAGILQQIHQNNYFHRDIKPDNVMIRTSGQLTLVDFGAAREMTQTYLAQMSQGNGVTAISSAGYTPPEQEQGQAVPQSDFYALGRTLIYLLTAKSPSDTTLYDPFENRFEWRSQAPQVSPELADLIDSMIAPRVVDRPKTGQDILAHIQALLAQPSRHPIGNTATDLPETTLPPIAPPQMPGLTTALQPGIIAPWESLTELAGPAPGLFKTKRPRWRWAAVVLIGVVAVGGSAIALRSFLPATLTALTTAPLPAPPEVRVQLHKTLSAHGSSINDLLLFADGQRLLSASADKTIRLWDLRSGSVLRTWDKQTSFVNTVLLSPDETQLYSGNADGTLQSWAIAADQPSWQQPLAHSGAVNTLGRTPDGQRLVSGGADGTLHIWDASTGQGLRSLSAHQGAVNTLVITADGQYILSGGTDRDVKVWDIDSGELVQTFQGHGSFVNALVLSPDGRFLFSASADGTVRHWQIDTGELIHTLEGHESYVNDVVFSRDGQTLSSSSADQTIRFWDGETGDAEQALTGFGMPVDHLVMSSTGQIVTASRTTSAIKIWLPDQ